MRVLVDQDGVIANFELAVYTRFLELHPGDPGIKPENRVNFKVKEDYPECYKASIESIYNAKGFYRNLPPIEGAIESLREMQTIGLEVYICTSPLETNKHCISEKCDWIAEHLGESWLDRTIVTSDKTLVKAHYLIDDKPIIKGAEKPTWEHVLYSQPYNSQITAKQRLTWNNWKRILLRDWIDKEFDE